MRASRATTAAVALLLTSVAVGATTGSNIGPLWDVDEASVDVLVGFSLAMPWVETLPLFGSDLDRKTAFVDEVAARVAQELKLGGLTVATNSSTLVQVGVFGGSFERPGIDTSFFMVTVSVCKSSEEICMPERTVLGVADEANLEAELIRTIAAVVREFVDMRREYREKQRPPA